MLPPPEPDSLPIRTHLTDIVAALTNHGTAVLVSPPGTGKTTLVPLALADEWSGRIVVTQPRRVAARAAAHRMASLVGEPVGGRVGYSVRGENKRSKKTRVEVVTTGLLVRRLQQDPELAGVAAVVIDECHERSLDTDLALAFAVDIRANLRPDLRILAMSATTRADTIAATLGGEVPSPVVEIDSVGHPVETIWCAPSSPVVPAHGTRVDPELLRHVAAVVHRAVTETSGDVLVFLPGRYEIVAVATQLGLAGVSIQELHGGISAAEQNRILAPAAGRRVVLASAIAESSLTVPGVRAVVDAGLSRVVRADLSRGLSALVTIRESKASATQRAGRAGRQGPGRAYRCWAESEQEWLPDFPEPEVAVADLTSYALELACWGNPRGNGLAFLDPPPTAAMDSAMAVLGWLGAIDGQGRVTPRGRAMSTLGLHPRLGRSLLDGAAVVGSRRAAEVVALLSIDERSTSFDDLFEQWRTIRDGGTSPTQQLWRTEVTRLHRPEATSPLEVSGLPSDLPDEVAAAIIVGMAFPERISKIRDTTSDAREDSRTYLMAGGTAAELPRSSRLLGSKWLAIATADRPPGHPHARIRSAVTLDEATALQLGGPLLGIDTEVAWRSGDVRAEEIERLGAITLVRRRMAEPDRSAVGAAIREGLRQEGLRLFRWTSAAINLRARIATCRSGMGSDWPAVDDAALIDHLDISAATNRADLQRIDLVSALRGLLTWQQTAQLDLVVPEQISVPSGSGVRVDYSDPDAPTLSVRVQEVFGWSKVPMVAGRPLRLNLLTPAGRTAAITTDLRTFWTTGYPGLRAELRGRYPRHPWPADPATAAPTKRANPKRQS